MAKSNNPKGRNQHSGGVMDMARESPMTTALGAAAAVGAGVFLWSRRNQISDQISSLSDQIGEWSQGMGWTGGSSGEFSDDTAGLTTSATTGSRSTGTRSRGRSRKAPTT